MKQQSKHGYGTPAPSAVRVPLDLVLKPGWAYDPERGDFVSSSGEVCGIRTDLPKGARVGPKMPQAFESAGKKITAEQQEMRRYWQVVLPEGTAPGQLLKKASQWTCVASATVGPSPSLPGMGPMPPG